MNTLSSYHHSHFYYPAVINKYALSCMVGIRFEINSLLTIIPTVKMREHHSFLLTQKKPKFPGALSPETHLSVYRAKDDLELLIPPLQNWRQGNPTRGLCSADGQTQGFALHRFSLYQHTFSLHIYSLWNRGFSP